MIQNIFYGHKYDGKTYKSKIRKILLRKIYRQITQKARQIMAKTSAILAFILLGSASIFGLNACKESPQKSPQPPTQTKIQTIKNRGELIVGVKNDVPFFALPNQQNGELEGFEIDIAKALAKEILGDEKRLKLIVVDVKNRGPLLENDSVDLIIASFSITHNRKKAFNFSKPYYEDSLGLLVRKNSGYKSLADMNGTKIGITPKGTTREILSKVASNMDIELKFSEFPNHSSIKSALESKKIDAFCVDKSILLGYVDENSEILPDNLAKQKYGIVSKKSNTDLALFVDEFVGKNSALLESLSKKWNLK